MNSKNGVIDLYHRTTFINVCVLFGSMHFLSIQMYSFYNSHNLRSCIKSKALLCTERKNRTWIVSVLLHTAWLSIKNAHVPNPLKMHLFFMTQQVLTCKILWCKHFRLLFGDFEGGQNHFV